VTRRLSACWSSERSHRSSTRDPNARPVALEQPPPVVDGSNPLCVGYFAGEGFGRGLTCVTSPRIARAPGVVHPASRRRAPSSSRNVSRLARGPRCNQAIVLSSQRFRRVRRRYQRTRRHRRCRRSSKNEHSEYAERSCDALEHAATIPSMDTATRDKGFFTQPSDRQPAGGRGGTSSSVVTG
jgi:hypothetical protein